MRVSPISISYNNQIINNKIQNRQRLNTMANGSVSFSAKKITDEMNRQAWRSILPNFLETDEHDYQPHARSFWKLDDNTIKAIARMSDDKTKKEFSTNRSIVYNAHKAGKIGQLLEFAKNDDEVLSILNTRIATSDNYGPRIEGPLKGALSFHDVVTALEKIKNIQKKKELLLSSWEQEATINYPDKNPKRTRETVASRLRLQDFSLGDKRNKPSHHPLGETPKEPPSPEQMLKDMQKLYFAIMEIVQDDSTTNKEAVEVIKNYKEFCGPAYKFYFDEIEKQLTTQIVLTEE